MDNLIEAIDKVFKAVWIEDISLDYESSFLLKEDSLKNALYFHLRQRLSDDFLNKNNLRIFTEYKVLGDRVDLVIVEIDPNMAESHHLRDCVKRVLVSVELKYKSDSDPSPFIQDSSKILRYIEGWGRDTKHYLVFIHENEYDGDHVTPWIDDHEHSEVKGLVTELFSYYEKGTDNIIWTIFEH